MRGLALLALVIGSGCGNLFGLLTVSLDQDAGSDGATDATMSDADPDATVDAMLDAPPTPKDAPPPPNCPPGYADNNGRVIKVNTTPMQWASAQQTCLSERGNAILHTHLIVIGDETERSQVGALLSTPFWIGLTARITPGKFIWVTNETSSYPPASGGPWASGEPSTSNGDDCVIQLGNDDFDATICTSLYQFVCECDAFPNQSNNY